MNTKAEDTPLSVNAMHAEDTERKPVNHFEEGGFFHLRHDLRLEQETVG